MPIDCSPPPAHGAVESVGGCAWPTDASCRTGCCWRQSLAAGSAAPDGSASSSGLDPEPGASPAASWKAGTRKRRHIVAAAARRAGSAWFASRGALVMRPSVNRSPPSPLSPRGTARRSHLRVPSGSWGRGRPARSARVARGAGGRPTAPFAEPLGPPGSRAAGGRGTAGRAPRSCRGWRPGRPPSLGRRAASRGRAPPSPPTWCTRLPLRLRGFSTLPGRGGRVRTEDHLTPRELEGGSLREVEVGHVRLRQGRCWFSFSSVCGFSFAFSAVGPAVGPQALPSSG